MVISVNPPRSSSILLDGKDVLRQTHSPRVLSKSIEARYSSVSYLNTGNGLSGGHLPARSNLNSARCTGDVSPVVLGLARSCSFNFMPERLSGDRRCSAYGRARPSRHPLQPHFNEGRIL